MDIRRSSLQILITILSHTNIFFKGIPCAPDTGRYDVYILFILVVMHYVQWAYKC